MELDKMRLKLDRVLDDYIYYEKNYKDIVKIYKVYNQMKDLLEEMTERGGDLDDYETDEIFKGIEEVDQLGVDISRGAE
ncbi:hypothetical protein ACU3L3_07100 [Priestia endophytica]